MNYRQCTLEKPCGQDFNGYQGVYKSVIDIDADKIRAIKYQLLGV